MHHILLMFLLGACSALARPSKDVEMLVSSDYGPLDDALQDNENLEQELLRRFYNGARLRLHRKMDTFSMPIKRIPRIGGTIVMGRKK
ncbi:unnamed protein product [Heligmosomoides polygyrus]|uniref:Short neuropeptide F n=1 Tax=Heligmosomoides polygyrus TaxID=6339 RepID=A0A3P7YC59_HELPZ|nr:unnamed protein product [Heligmosomoides polygyrus]